MFGSIALAAGVWGLLLVAGYGRSLSIGSWRISSHNPLRPLLVCILSTLAYWAVSGRRGLSADLTRLFRLLSGVTAIGRQAARVNPTFVAILIAASSVGIAFAFRESTAGGSDAYTYVTQADLWIARTPKLRIEMPIAVAAPWPSAIDTFTPFGYRSTSDRRAVVPVSPPGLPLLMAAFALVGGHCAMFSVVPLTGGLLVWSTYLIGRRIESAVIGLSAAWLVATSPTFLSMNKSIMSDVPAAAFWALAIAALLRPSTASMLGAGLSASAAILIRPNLLPIGAVIIAWIIWRELQVPENGRAARLAAFTAGFLPGCFAVAGFNRWLYGSAAASGYGDLRNLFDAGNIGLNVRRYATWLADTQTPLALAGIAALMVPARRIWSTPASRAAAWLLALVIAAVAAVYAAYTPFHDWWYLRFFLPAWPAIFIGTSALIIGLTRRRGPWIRAAAVLVLLALGVHGIRTARQLGVYPPGEGERRYATIADLIARVTDPSAAIITTAHVGPLRYYGGRLTVRYDVLDPGWLDRAIGWLELKGRHPYVLLEEQEEREFTERFGSISRTGRLEMTPVLVYEAHEIAGRVSLYDPRNPTATTWYPAPVENPQPRCPAPAAPPDYSVQD